ncbi:MAG: DNA translocase FtsK [Taibaiella sp.]|nr:DNA translocase FtsK [Taibaiella sp.]
MPKTTQRKRTPSKKSSSPSPLISPKKWSRENIQLFSGIVLTLLGGFLCVSILSYFSTWKIDQSAIQSSESLFSYILNGDVPVANISGKLGAAFAHGLVYNGIGIMAIVFTLWLTALGVNLLYGRKVIPTNKWIRWMALGFLFLCPLLSLVFSKSEFSFGGNLGNSLISWSDNVAGLPGSIFMLILVFTFFTLIVFQWDIKPWLESVRNLIPARSERDTPEAYSSSSIAPVPPAAVPHMGLLDDDEYTEGEPDRPFRGNTYEGNPDDFNIMIHESLVEEDDMGIKLVEIEADRDKSGQLRPEENIAAGMPIEADQAPVIQKNGIAVELPPEDEEIQEIPQVSSIPVSLSDSPAELRKDSGEEAPERESSSNVSTEVPGLVVITSKEEEQANISGSQSVAKLEPYAPELDLRDYRFPILDLLEDKHMESIALNAEELAKNKEQITNTLKSFGIEISQIQATVGPTVTLYEIVPQEGVRISKIRNLEDDIALNLAALGIRMIAPIPGRGTIGIEVPNAKKQVVPMRALLASEKFINNDMSLPIALGKKIDNENYIVDLASMPHLLMAGATGQGKSVGINAILVSLLYKKHPSQLKFVLVDPKKVELSVYRLIENHYLAKLPNEEEAIITDTKKVINTLNSLCIEMDNRYELLKDAGTRNIKEYNDKFIKRRLNPESGHKYLPFIVLVVDEFADLIMTAGKEVEMPVARLAQLARAVGIHLIVATQRPSVNVITGIIKANFPARIAFRVTSKVDSRTILDTGGADQLIGRGDMLVSHGSELLRLQCAFVDTPEVERIVEFIGAQRGYPSAFELPEYEGAEDEAAERKDVDLTKKDKMFEDCARLVVNSQSGSTSMLQRKFNLGYNRAGRIMDQLEAAGIVGGQVGSKPRDVLVSSEYELDQILGELNN